MATLSSADPEAGRNYSASRFVKNRLIGAVPIQTPEDFNAPYGLYSENSAFPDKQNQSVSEGQKRGVHRIYRGGILGPKSVIRTEVIDAREWEETISKGGQEFKRICRASANRMRSAK